MSAKYKSSDYEVLRRRCVALREVGCKQKDIASALGLTEGWVSQTLMKHRENGLLARKPTGSPPKITAQELPQLVKELNLGAVSHGFPRPRLDACPGQCCDRQVLWVVRHRGSVTTRRRWGSC